MNWVRSGVLDHAAELAQEWGGEPQALALQCCLEPAALYAQDLPVQGTAVVGFLEAAAEATDCADFGIRLASRQSFAVLGSLWLLMRRAQSVQDALKYLRRSNLRAAQVGEILGYSEPAACSRAFRRLTPSQARGRCTRKE